MLSIPMVATSLNDDNIQAWAEAFVAARADRAFVFFNADFSAPKSELDEQINRFCRLKELLHKMNIEVGAWINAFSSFTINSTDSKKYVKQQGIIIKSKQDFCPLDEKYLNDFCKYIRSIAAAHPDLIMLDDDYRLGVRQYPIGCFCKLHRRLFAKEYGFPLSALSIYKKAYCGKPAKAREIILKINKYALENFATRIRAAVDSVDENIRLGACMCLDTLDLEGIDPYTLSKILAGKTRPFFRTSGAPYWQIKAVWGDSRATAEYTRMQGAWYKDQDVEIFAEGDVFPRPRYNIPASVLEVYDAYIKADGNCGILKYIFDYKYPLGYENGYPEHHSKNYQIISEIAAEFDKKQQTGIEIFEHRDKIRSYDLSRFIPSVYDKFGPPSENVVKRFFQNPIRRPYQNICSGIERSKLLTTESFSRAQRLFSANGIPTTYIASDGAVVCFGENARHLPESYFNRGLILDCIAAKILTEKGIDVGLKQYKRCYPSQENFGSTSDIELTALPFLCSVECSPAAEITSTYDTETVASYFYKNSDDQRFCVLGINSEAIPLTGNDDYFLHYYRAEHLRRLIQKVSETKLSAYTVCNPNMALLCAKGENDEYSVGLFNFFPDSALNVKIILRGNPLNARFINCKGKCENDTLIVDEISGYGFASVSFELL